MIAVTPVGAISAPMKQTCNQASHKLSEFHMLPSHRALFDSVRRLLLRRAPEQFSRRWPRVAIAEPAQVRLPNGGGKPVIINQLSVGGARIQVGAQLKEGDDVELQFDDGAEGRQSLAARIIYSLRENPGQYFACGLCFLGLKAHQAQWIAAYIAAQQARRRAAQAESTSSSSAAES